jgi:hypothetical protein
VRGTVLLKRGGQNGQRSVGGLEGLAGDGWLVKDSFSRGGLNLEHACVCLPCIPSLHPASRAWRLVCPARMSCVASLASLPSPAISSPTVPLVDV